MNETIMKDAFAALTEEQVAFVCKEFGIEADELSKKSEDELNEIYESLCDAEVDEICKAQDAPLSERGKAVCGIVTVVGNEIAKAQGDYDEDEFEASLSDDEE